MGPGGRVTGPVSILHVSSPANRSRDTRSVRWIPQGFTARFLGARARGGRDGLPQLWLLGAKPRLPIDTRTYDETRMRNLPTACLFLALVPALASPAPVVDRAASPTPEIYDADLGDPSGPCSSGCAAKRGVGSATPAAGNNPNAPGGPVSGLSSGPIGVQQVVNLLNPPQHCGP